MTGFLVLGHLFLSKLGRSNWFSHQVAKKLISCFFDKKEMALQISLVDLYCLMFLYTKIDWSKINIFALHCQALHLCSITSNQFLSFKK